MTIAFTCHPVERLKLGRFEFTKSSLKLDSDDDVAEFRALLDKQPHFVKAKVRELSVEAADKFAAKFLEGRRVTGIDTTRNSIGAPQPQASGEPIDPVETEREGANESDEDSGSNVNEAAPLRPLQFGTRPTE